MTAISIVVSCTGVFVTLEQRGPRNGRIYPLRVDDQGHGISNKQHVGHQAIIDQPPGVSLRAPYPNTSMIANAALEKIVPPPAEVEAAEWIVACLEKAGVDFVFGVPGGAVEPIYNALAKSSRRGGPRPVVARHEAGAAFMADGYARETGRLGVCLGTSGPGATNLITGVACAFSNRIPVLAITGQPALPSFGRGALQESACTGVNAVGMFGHCTRYNSLVSHTDQVETKVINAIRHALRPPRGPAHLSFPVDILRGPLAPKSHGYDLSTLLQNQPSLIDEQSIAALVAKISSSSRVLFLIGDGSTEAIDSIMTLVELTGASFITTPDAKGLVNPFHQAYRGVFGLGGHDSANQVLLDGPDLVVAFGTSFGEFASSGFSPALLNDRLIHVDESEENLMRTPMARLHVHGRLRAVCEKTVEAYKSASRDVEPPSRRRVRPEASGVTLQSPEKYHSEASPIKPQRLMKELSHRFPPSTRFVADAGNSMMWAPHYLQPANRRWTGNVTPIEHVPNRRSRTSSWLRVTMEFAPMGWAIGAAVGIARGNTRCAVVCITGDGSYLMSGQEITTAAQERLPVIFVILNDHAYGMVMHGQRLAGAEPIAYELPRVDFRAMAESMGIAGHVVESPADFELIDWDEMVRQKGPTLIDVRIDREEVPPMTMRLKALGSVKD